MDALQHGQDFAGQPDAGLVRRLRIHHRGNRLLQPYPRMDHGWFGNDADRGPAPHPPGLDGPVTVRGSTNRPSAAASAFTRCCSRTAASKWSWRPPLAPACSVTRFPASDQARVLLDFLLPNEYEMKVLKARVRRSRPGRDRRHHRDGFSGAVLQWRPAVRPAFRDAVEPAI